VADGSVGQETHSNIVGTVRSHEDQSYGT
jgi:hypothetical protein